MGNLISIKRPFMEVSCGRNISLRRGFNDLPCSALSFPAALVAKQFTMLCKIPSTRLAPPQPRRVRTSQPSPFSLFWTSSSVGQHPVARRWRQHLNVARPLRSAGG